VTSVVSATVFWLPNVAVSGLWPRTSAGAPYWYDYGIPLITIACPAALALLISLRNRNARTGRPKRFPLTAALVGIWALAPGFTLLTLAVRSSDDVLLLAAMIVRHPIAAYMMVVAQGAIYALFVATVMLVGMYLYELRETRRIA